MIATGIYKFMFKSYAKYHSKTLKSLLDELTDDEELKTVLSYCWGDYGKKCVQPRSIFVPVLKPGPGFPTSYVIVFSCSVC